MAARFRSALASVACAHLATAILAPHSALGAAPDGAEVARVPIDLTIAGFLGLDERGRGEDDVGWSLPLTTRGLFVLGIQPLPVLGLDVRVGVDARDSAPVIGASVRSRPVQAKRTWSDYAWRSMHALTFGFTADHLVGGPAPIEVSATVGYEYRSVGGFVGRLEQSFGTTIGGPDLGGSFITGLTLFAGGTF